MRLLQRCPAKIKFVVKMKVRNHKTEKGQALLVLKHMGILKGKQPEDGELFPSATNKP